MDFSVWNGTGETVSHCVIQFGDYYTHTVAGRISAGSGGGGVYLYGTPRPDGDDVTLQWRVGTVTKTYTIPAAEVPEGRGELIFTILPDGRVGIELIAPVRY